MPHPFDSAHHLVENAKKRMDDLIGHLIAFGENLDDYARRLIQDDGQTPYHLYGVEFIKPVPTPIVIATRDVLHDLRAALDHVAFACAKKPDAKSAYFPFAKGKGDLKGVIKRRCRDLPPEIVELMAAHRPYGDEDGDKLLYALNDMRNFNDHRLLQPMAQMTQLVKIKTETRLSSEKMIHDPEAFRNLMPYPQMFFPPHRVPDENKTFFLRFDSRITEEPEVHFAIYIGFGDVGHFNNAPPVYIFRQMIPMVEGIIAGIDRHTSEKEIFDAWRR